MISFSTVPGLSQTLYQSVLCCVYCPRDKRTSFISITALKISVIKDKFTIFYSLKQYSGGHMNTEMGFDYCNHSSFCDKNIFQRRQLSELDKSSGHLLKKLVFFSMLRPLNVQKTIYLVSHGQKTSLKLNQLSKKVSQDSRTILSRLHKDMVLKLQKGI